MLCTRVFHCIFSDETVKLRQLTAVLSERETEQARLIGQLEEDVKKVSTWRRQQEDEESDFFDTQQYPGSLSLMVRAEANEGKQEESLSFPPLDSAAHSDESSFLKIVQSQRDRFRDRVRELEEVRLRFFTWVQSGS